jgi:hypothetical protein
MELAHRALVVVQAAGCLAKSFAPSPNFAGCAVRACPEVCPGRRRCTFEWSKTNIATIMGAERVVLRWYMRGARHWQVSAHGALFLGARLVTESSWC